MEKFKTRGKLGYPGEILTYQDGRQLLPDPENLEHSRGNRNWEIPPQKNTTDTHETYAMQKAYLAMNCSARLISASSDPSQIFVWGPINFLFGHMTRTDPKGHYGDDRRKGT